MLTTDAPSRLGPYLRALRQARKGVTVYVTHPSIGPIRFAPGWAGRPNSQSDHAHGWGLCHIVARRRQEGLTEAEIDTVILRIAGTLAFGSIRPSAGQRGHLSLQHNGHRVALTEERYIQGATYTFRDIKTAFFVRPRP